jgi:uncharacterized protein
MKVLPDLKSIEPGSAKRLRLEVARLYDSTRIYVPLRVYRGLKPGPMTFISAGVHGDEVCGIEIARRLLSYIRPERIEGTLIVVPLINVYGFFGRSRYLPDRRDLNRSFPGNEEGSLASQVAHRFLKYIGARCRYGIDLHSGSNYRNNWPQIRGDMTDPETLKLARLFNAPAILHSNARDGSMRKALSDRGKKVLLFEGGEALKIDPEVVDCGLSGCLSVLSYTNGYKGPTPKACDLPQSKFFKKSSWLRAPKSGMLITPLKCGDFIKKGQLIGHICSPNETKKLVVRSPLDGTVIGGITSPMIFRGDALFHVAHPC